MLGFGLLLCKQISEKYGGKLEFISEYNIGSTFAFSFEIELNNDVEIE
jgi:signal transduction histidine kinase